MLYISSFLNTVFVFIKYYIIMYFVNLILKNKSAPKLAFMVLVDFLKFLFV